MKGKVLLAIFVALLIGTGIDLAQTGTQHGVLVSWTPGSIISGGPAGDAVAGYNIYRCLGTCTASQGGWVKIDATLDLGLSYLDASANLSPNTTYSYAATTVDTLGNESAFSPIATVAFVVIPNPNAPSGCSAKSQ